MVTKKIGVTGGIGAGKTVVCRIFRSLGIPVYDADKEARQLMIEHKDLIASIKQHFGEDAYLEEGLLNRDFLAQHVFNDREQLNKLNGLVHPVVKHDFEAWLQLHKSGYVIKEAALLFETGSYRQLDKTICVTAPEPLRIRRVLDRDEFRRKEEVQKIIENQWDEAEKKKLADFIIVNDDSKMLLPQILKIHDALSN